jgi:hypothetical protein
MWVHCCYFRKSVFIVVCARSITEMQTNSAYLTLFELSFSPVRKIFISVIYHSMEFYVLLDTAQYFVTALSVGRPPACVRDVHRTAGHQSKPQTKPLPLLIVLWTEFYSFTYFRYFDTEHIIRTYCINWTKQFHNQYIYWTWSKQIIKLGIIGFLDFVHRPVL